MRAPSYRARLRTEGLTLAACGAVGSAALLLADDRATENAGSTAGQLALVLVALLILGPRSIRQALAGSEPEGVREATGEPTPLWQLPLVVAGLTAPWLLVGTWDAGLRVTLGCTLVGLVQGVLLARLVAAEERRTGRRYVRAPGSRILRGTLLAHTQLRA